MEIVLSNLSSSNKKFDKVSMDLSNVSFVAIEGIDFPTFYDLLVVNKRPASGKVKIGKIEVMHSNKVEDINKVIRKIGFVSDKLFFEYEDCIVSDIFSRFFKDYKLRKIEDKNAHMVDSLKFVGLSKSLLKRKFNELSYTEQKKILLACVISVNPSLLVLDEFDRGLSFRDRENFKKLFLKLCNKFDKQFVFINSDIKFVMGYVNKMIVINNGNVVYEGDKNFCYDEKVYKYISMPKIVSFTNYVNSNGHDIIEYTDTKELLKELYRKIK